MAAELPELAYQLALRSLDRQESGLDKLRARTDTPPPPSARRFSRRPPFSAAGSAVRHGRQRRQRDGLGRVRGAAGVHAASGVESWTLIGPDRGPVEPVDRYLSQPTFVERSPNTIAGYARDLKAYFTFRAERGLRRDRVGVAEPAEFAAWVRRPAANESWIWQRAKRAAS